MSYTRQFISNKPALTGPHCYMSHTHTLTDTHAHTYTHTHTHTHLSILHLYSSASPFGSVVVFHCLLSSINLNQPLSFGTETLVCGPFTGQVCVCVCVRVCVCVCVCVCVYISLY